MLRHHTIPVTPFEQNCSLVWCDRTMDGAIVDPGGDLPLIHAALRRLGIVPRQILLTVFVPGHGPESSFGRERRSNRFVGGTRVVGRRTMEAS